ncbi:MAG TPA: hypothetical protein VFK58_01760 [Sphingomicrobium sp.]|nr:hypothetical protein [Sphingomicrobium sp.]
MQQSDLFAYLVAFLSIVLAVALTDMIQSTHRLIRAGDRVKWDILTPLLALLVFSEISAVFFSLWSDARFDRLSYHGLLAFLTQPLIQALLAFAVLPDEVPERGLDLRQFYFANRRYFAVLLLAISVTDWAAVYRWASLHHAFGNADFWWNFLPTTSIQLAATLIIFFATSWRMQLGALIVKLLLAQYTFSAWYIDVVPTPAG